MKKKYIVEFIGTFTLALLIVLSANNSLMPTPLIAGLTLMLFVYLIGAISGSHINPAVTIGLLSIKKISAEESQKYIVSQVLGGFTALALVSVSGFAVSSPGAIRMELYFFEFLGMVLFTFGIGFIVFNKINSAFDGVIIGLSLLLGILISVYGGAAGILNPAVGIALKTTFVEYYIVQFLGGVAGFQSAKYLYNSK